MGAVRISRPESNFSIQVRPYRQDFVHGNVNNNFQSTGFVWEIENTWYLVTNLHVVTGWNPVTREAISKTGFNPTHLEINFAVDVSCGENGAHQLLKRNLLQVPIIEEDGPNWLVHPTLGDAVDVAIIPLFATSISSHLDEIGAKSMITQPVNKHSEWVAMDLCAGDDAFVVGFPHGMNSAGFPIWKRASLATEPDIDLDGLPKFLVDTATRKGMSGSPVIAVRRGITMPNGKFDGDAIIGEAMCFAGVYSGRIGEDEMGVQLGIVWKARIIDEIISAGVRGELPW